MSNEPPAQRPRRFSAEFMRRRSGDLLLFSVTVIEMWLLLREMKTFTAVDWVYVLSNVFVLVIALARRAPQEQDRSVSAAAAVIVSYAYPYAQVIVLRWTHGTEVSPVAGLILVVIGACGSLASLLSLGRFFGVRPALRGLAIRGPYRLVRHPMYLSYVIADIGYNLQEWNYYTLILVAAGWASMIYRIYAEERMLSRDPSWADFSARVRYRLLPGIW
jgi:protein-S-isoprenylcysteine O-methyltransferase Ste14